ncbi:hypothetical protein ACJJTC_016153 [Scirpophaga incertulas]
MFKNFNNKNYVSGDQNVKVPAHLNFGKFMLDRIRHASDAVALENSDTEEVMTYRELTQFAVNLATLLCKLGVSVGDVVAIGSERRNEFVATILGIVFSGATYTPYDLKSGRAVLRHKIELTKPSYFICSNQFWLKNGNFLRNFHCIKTFLTLDDDIDEIIIPLKSLNKNIDVDLFEPVEVRGGNDLAVILYSSGTTGMPKGVQLTHLNCILNSLPDDFNIDSLQTMFLYGEWYHNYDTFMTYKFLAMGKRIVYLNCTTPELFLKCVQDKKIDIAMIIPSLVGRLSKLDNLDKFNLDTLKFIYSRSSPLHVKTIENLRKRIPKLKVILQGYGMTEAGELTSETWGFKGPKPGSVGMASPGITLKIVDPETRVVLGPNQRGEICLKGPVFMKGYIGVDPSTYLDTDGFFKTGDLGYYDEDRYFYIVDRMKEIITFDGIQIAPLELETILLSHPAVKEAGVVGKSVLYFGEVPTAFVVKMAGCDVTEEELIDYVASEVSPEMQLRGGVFFIKELPRNPRGKLLRKELKEMLNECSKTIEPQIVY